MSKPEYSKLTPRMLDMQRKIDSASTNRTGVASKAYQQGWERIFNKVKSPKKAS
jgi:hypothetical protein